MIVSCPRCGSPNAERNRFCVNCGGMLDEIGDLKNRIEFLEKELIAKLDSITRSVNEWGLKIKEIEDHARNLANSDSKAKAARFEAIPLRAAPTEKKEHAYLYAGIAIVSALLLGFMGYYFGFLQTFVYGVMVPNAFSKFNLYSLAVIAGVAAFFSPCSFPVLPSYMSYLLASEDHQTRRLFRSAHLGVVAGLGVTLVNMFVGSVIAYAGAAAPFQPDPRKDEIWILGVRIAAGIAITLLGAVTLSGQSFHFPSVGLGSRISKASHSSGMAKKVFLYGAGYNAAGFGCTGPILLSLMLYAFLAGSFTIALGAFIVFSVTMAILMILVTMFAGLAKDKLLRRLGTATPKIKKLSGIVLILVGFLTVSLTGNELFVRLLFPFLP